MPEISTIPVSVLAAAAADVSLGTHKLTAVVDPASAQDGATKAYVDSALAGYMSNPMTTLGDILYENATPVPARLAGNTTTTKKFLRQTGTGSGSAAPAWDTIVAADLPTLSGITAPAGDVSLNSHKITSLTDPSSAQDAATKAYVDTVAIAVTAGFDVKASCRVATTANITLSGAQTIDGVSVIAGERVLVKNQSTGANNGIYLCASGSWTRATDADTSAEVTSGMFTFISEGSTLTGTQWLLTTADPITLGSTALVFTQFGAGGGGTVTTVSVVTANGVSGSVATATTTPAITLTLGAITPTSVAATGSGSFIVSDSATATTVTVLTLGHNTSGTPAGAFASSILWKLQDTTTTNVQAAEVRVQWNVATHASRTATWILNVSDSGSTDREAIRASANGSDPLISFLGGVAPAARQTGDAGTALVTFGLMSGTPTFNAANLTNNDLLGSDDTMIQCDQGTPTITFYVNGVAVGAWTAAGLTMVNPLSSVASTNAAAGFRVIPGTAPDTPAEGDWWLTIVGAFYRCNGATVGPLTGDAYVPGTPGDWAGSAPATIAEALDRLAAANPGA